MWGAIRLKIRMWRIRRIFDMCYSNVQSSSPQEIKGDICPGLIYAWNNVNICKQCPHYFARR